MPKVVQVKKAAIIILFCSATVPAALLAQATNPPAKQRVIGTKWSLGQPKEKAAVVGPAVPPPPVVRVKRPAQQVARPERKPRPNNKALVSAIASGKRKR